MATEYQPISSVVDSRRKLAELATQVEISEQALFESSLDVLASRGGERWRDLDDIALRTGFKSHMLMVVSYRAAEPDYPEHVGFMVAGPGESNFHAYEVRKDSSGAFELGEKYFPNAKSEGEFKPVVNWGGLAPARLLSILEKAHRATPNRPQPKDAYRPR